MPSELHLPNNQSDEHAAPEVPWSIFYFERCNNFTAGRATWIVSNLLCFATGFPACVLILRKIMKPRWSGTPLTPNSLFILHLTIMDTIFLTTIPLGILNHMIWKYFAVEAAWNTFYAFTLCGRPLMMAFMCLDCYVAVVHPITYHKRKSMTPRIVMICFVWFCLLVFGVILSNFSDKFGVIALGPFTLTIIIASICDSLILQALLKPDSGKKNIHQQKKRAVHTLINSLVMMIFVYLPPIVMVIIGKAIMTSDAFFCTIELPGYGFSTFGSAVMPILHLVSRKKPRCRTSVFPLLNIWCCRRPGKQSPSG